METIMDIEFDSFLADINEQQSDALDPELVVMLLEEHGDNPEAFEFIRDLFA
jgi:hypothetical protein